jgi:hypothetical protein
VHAQIVQQVDILIVKAQVVALQPLQARMYLLLEPLESPCVVMALSALVRVRALVRLALKTHTIHKTEHWYV